MSQPPLGRSTPLVPPLYQSSVYTLPDLDALDRIMNAEEPGYIYARDAHPNARHLAAELATWEAADWAVICGSGMAAISAFLLAILQHGDRLVASNRLYGRTTQLLDQELGRFGVRTAFVDCNDLGAVQRALAEPAKVLFVETVSNPMLRVVDVAGLAPAVMQGGCGHMLSFEVRNGRDGVNRFMRLATGIPFSPSLGHPTTTLSHPASTSHRYVSPAERRRQGITDELIRLSVGVEDLEHIQREMAKGLGG